MRLIRILLRIAKHIKEFGLFKGVQIFLMLKLQKKGTMTFSLEGLLHPFKIRTQTSDAPIFRQVFLDREYDFKLGFEPKSIIDAGANIGMAAIFFANRHPKSTIISIEPEHQNFGMLKENTAHYSNVISVQYALSNINDQQVSVADNGYGTAGFMMEKPSAGSKNLVKTISIDEIMKQYNYSSLDLVKIDIEGYEKELFSSNTDWIQHTKCLVIELHDRMKPGCSESVLKVISRFDFSSTQIGENLIFTNKNFSIATQ